ncbi:MAG: histidine phosphatase family protein [Alphaproteobacteria bacterium]|nr:histidine phosphatase family protein [Alphaproteobacteria bacterium]
MTRTLLLLRHAKSSWAGPGQADHDRPLAPRGRKAAVEMGRMLRARGLIPDLVLLSTARRTVETWELLAPELGRPVPARRLKSLYLAGPQRLLTVLRRVDPTIGKVMLIGHNPGLHGLALLLVVAGDPVLRDRLAEKYPTAALAAIAVAEAPWRDLSQGSGTLAQFLTPRRPED